MARKVFGTKDDSRSTVPVAKRAVGVEGDEEFFAEYFNQILFETNTDYVLGSPSSVVLGNANIKVDNGTQGQFLDITLLLRFQTDQGL
jgi:hypothetical protein